MNKAHFLIIPLIILSMCAQAFSGQKVKKPNVSGQFYSANPLQLTGEIDRYIKNADIKPYDKHIDIIVAPHAGYMYSGPVAGFSFKAVSNTRYKTIVILAPSHYYGFDGISVWEQGGFETPLGTAAVDVEMSKKIISANEKFYYEPNVFEKEHSLEVEIPFLQRTFKDFKIVPVIMGQPSFDTLNTFASALKDAIGTRKDVLIVVSSDMSHYHDGKTAQKMDQYTLEAIKSLNAEKFFKECALRTMEMCGFIPVTAAMLYARLQGLNNVDVLRYAHSGDVTGDQSRVVGYSSIVFYGDAVQEASESSIAALNAGQKEQLLDIARKTIESYVREGKVLEFKISDRRLLEKEGAFVTIHKNGQLRGCIGNIIGGGPLALTVRNMAIAAAAEDPRFDAVSKDELESVDVEISVLSKPRVIKDTDEIILGTHGVIVSQGSRQGVFLPQVATDTGWSKEEFLSQLCYQKAHLPEDAWKDPKTKIEIFTADVFGEKEIK